MISVGLERSSLLSLDIHIISPENDDGGDKSQSQHATHSENPHGAKIHSSVSSTPPCAVGAHHSPPKSSS